jgi:sucrose-6-phosphate hydrolase SacC (GH32 family)
MRKLIIDKIYYYKSFDGFDCAIMRWEHAMYKNGIHYQDLDFNTLPDEDLVGVFEYIIKQFYKGY